MDFLSDSALKAAAVVVLVTQILKLKLIPVSFANRYPVPTNILLSLVATVVILNPSHVLDSLPTFVVQWFAVAVVAALAYNHLLAPWNELRSMEGEK